MIALKVAVAILSMYALYAVIHYGFLAMKRPERLLKNEWKWERGELPWWGKAEIYTAFFGGVVIATVGARGLLWWFPDSWGSVDDYGEFHSIEYGIAGLLGGLIGISVFLFLRRGAELQRDVNDLAAKLAAQEKRLTHELRLAQRESADRTNRIRELTADNLRLKVAPASGGTPSTQQSEQVRVNLCSRGDGAVYTTIPRAPVKPDAGDDEDDDTKGTRRR